MTYLKRKGIEVNGQHADLAPIENMWAIVQRSLKDLETDASPELVKECVGQRADGDREPTHSELPATVAAVHPARRSDYEVLA
jgi:hypothetical protein